MRYHSIKQLALLSLPIVIASMLGYPRIGDESLQLPEQKRVEKSIPPTSSNLSKLFNFSWTDLPPSGEKRTEAITFVADGKYYVFAGFNDYIDTNGDGTNELLTITDRSQVYNPNSQTWSDVAPIPEPVSHVTPVRYNQQVWIPGGFVGNNPGASTTRVQIYDLVSNSWSEGPPLPEPMASHGSARVAHYLHVYGGLMPDRIIDNNAHYVLDLTDLKQGWKKAAPLPIPRNHLAAVSLGGQLYAIGGQFSHDNGNLLKDLSYVHRYDPIADRWTRITDLPFQRSHFEPGTFVTPEGKIVIVGGRSEYGVPVGMARVALSNITEFDPRTQTWQDIGELPFRRLAPSAKALGDELIVSHGSINWFTPVDDAISAPFETTIRKELGVNPKQISLKLKKGERLEHPVFLWSYGEEIPFTIEQDIDSQEWLSIVNRPASTDPNSRELILDFQTKDLSVGTYQTTLEFGANNYQGTSLPVEIIVEEQFPKVLYIYGNVDSTGLKPTEAGYQGFPFEQMRLQDESKVGMIKFAEAITETGASIVEMYDQEITLTQEFLSQFDVIILGSNQKMWSPEEVEAINAWVRAGGGLIGYSDSAFGGHFRIVGVANEQGRDSNNLLMTQFGMYFFTDQGGAGGDNLVNQWSRDHFINTKDGKPRSLRFRGEGCSPIRILKDWEEKQPNDTVYQLAPFQNGGEGGTVNIYDPDIGFEIQNYDIDCAVAVAEIGKGRVVGTFDRNTFWNRGAGTDLSEVDNRLYIQKLINWVSGQTLGAKTLEIEGETKKWHLLTLSFEGPETSELASTNPFLDYRLDVTFTSPSQEKVYVIPGYYAADGNAAETGADEGNQWKVHFRPDEAGTWKYTVSFRSGEEVAISDDPLAGVADYFDGESGSIIIEDFNDPNDFRSKGFLQYVEAHFLRFQNGEWFLKAGTDSPETFLAYEGFDNTEAQVIRSDSFNIIKTYEPHIKDWEETDPVWQGEKGKGIIGAMNYIASEGNNSVSFLTYNAGGDGKNVWPFVAPDNPLRYDCSKLDQWEIVFSQADRKGIYLHFKTQETENDDDPIWGLDQGEVGTTRKLYYRELIARFGHHLALNWNLGEENTQSTEQHKAMAAFIKKIDPYGHPIVIHTFPGTGQQEQVYGNLLGDSSELSGPSLQLNFRQVHKQTLEWVRRSAEVGKKWVVANDEQGPFQIGVPPDQGWPGLDTITTPSQEDIRKWVLWGNLMAGGAGVEYYFGYQLPENDLNCQDFRSRDRMWDYNRYALEFFQKFAVPFWEMENQNALIGNSDDSNSKFCLAKPGEAYVIYLGEGGSTNILLEESDQTYDVFWYNPRQGGELQQGDVPFVTAGTEVSVGQPPAEPDQDWVVFLANLNTPVGIEPSLRGLSQHVKLFPNPGPEIIHVEFDQALQEDFIQAIIYDSQGNLITRTSLQKEENRWQAAFDTRHYAPGTYILRLKTKQGFISKRFVVK